MPASMILRLGVRAGRTLRRYLRDMNGVATVEFAYVLPVMLLMLVGMAEASRAISMDRRFALATSTVADLVAREGKLTAADVNAIYNIVSQIMSPFDASSLRIAIIPVKANPSNATQTRVYAATTNRPSYHGASQPTKCQAYTLPTGMVAQGASVIVVETQYSYTPIFLNYIYGSQTWTDKAIAAPRFSCVDFDNDNCISSCF